MPVGMRAPAAENRVRAVLAARRKCDTQLHAIRDLMLSAAQRGAWMTLGEIAGLTEIGEASISAQLRHLRKARHGRHRVEKRRRTFFVSGLQVQPAPVAAEAGFTPGARCDAKRRSGGAAVIWEYRVLPPAGWDAQARACSPEEEARGAARQAEWRAGDAGKSLSDISQEISG